MQQLIREEFEGRTIISVAHKLETVLDFDKVVVLDNGEIIESGNPRLLLSANSAFCKLYNTYRATRGDSGEAEEPATSEPLAAPAVIGEKHESMTEERLAEWGISFPER